MKKSRFLFSFLFIALAVIGSLAFTNKLGPDAICFADGVSGNCPPSLKCQKVSSSGLVQATPIMHCFIDAPAGVATDEECQELNCGQ